MSYLVLKWVHLLGASVLFGTGMGIAFFSWFGYRRAIKQDDLGLLQGVLALTVIADTVFTALAAVLQPLTGLGLWAMQGQPWDSSWLWWVIGLYLFVGACWLPVVILQIRLRDAAFAASSVAALGAGFHVRFRCWFALGLPAFAGVLVLFGLMAGRAHFV
jgi:uncharacterized membrane protein